MSNGDPRKLTLREDVTSILGPGAAPLAVREAYSESLPHSSYSGPTSVTDYIQVLGPQILAYATGNPLLGIAATVAQSGIVREFLPEGLPASPIERAQQEQLSLEQPRGGFTPWQTGGTYPGFSIREIYPGEASWRVESAWRDSSWEDKIEAGVTRQLFR